MSGSLSQTRLVDVDGLPVRARVTGSDSAPLLVLLHGIGRSLADWTEQHDLLSDRFRVISVDLPGFGESAARPSGAGGTLATMADGVAGALAAIGETRPATVVGNSLGGSVSMQLLAAHPELVARLVLVDAAGFGPEVTWLLRLLTVRALGPLTRRVTRPAATLAERSIFTDRTLVTADRVELALALGSSPGRGQFMQDLVRELGTVRGVRPEWRATLLAAAAAHRRPVLVVWGARDRVLPSRQVAGALAAFPHAQTWVIPDVGHMPQIEAPDQVAQLIAEFATTT